jgi:restriction endonuclease Mrr
MAGLLEKTGKGRFRITQRAKETMVPNPPTINMRFLLQFPEYAKARSRAKTDTPVELPETTVSESASPQERIELAFRELNNSLTTELRAKLASIDPFRNAREYATSLHQKLVLIDGRGVAELMIEQYPCRSRTALHHQGDR